MTTLNCTVLSGHTFVPDSQARIRITSTRLNELGLPTVTANLAGLIAAADLATALAAKIIGADISVAAEVSDAIDVTVQIQNAVGSDITGRHSFRCWLSDSEYGGETGTAPATGLSVTTGTQIKSVTANKQLIVETDASGTAVINVDNATGSTHSWYLMVELQNIVTASTVITITI